MITRTFNPPLSVPSSKVTMAKEYKDGRTEEAIIQNLLVITGRTYKNINGRLVPIGAGATVRIEGSGGNINSIIQKALQHALIAIMDDENNLSLHRG